VIDFWEYVNKTDSCWLWTGRVAAGTGYGVLSINGRETYAHRLSYEIAYGEIPDGLVTDHLCRVRLCVRPDHLEAVTTRENVMRGVGPTAINAQKTRCPKGHELTEANTYRRRDTKNGLRQCLTCRNESNARSNAKIALAKKLLRSGAIRDKETK
jgi:hypothetical protein